jgi:hypothetical protein
VLVRDASDGGHPQYRLSESGLDLWSLFLAMWLWEQDWGTAKDPDTWAPDLPRSSVVHLGCGQAMRPVLLCDNCQGEVQPFDTRLRAPELPADGAAQAQSELDRLRVSARARHRRFDVAGITRLSRVWVIDGTVSLWAPLSEVHGCFRSSKANWASDRPSSATDWPNCSDWTF